MANRKVTELPNIDALASGDLLHVVDISDISSSAEGTSKKTLLSQFVTYLNGFFATTAQGAKADTAVQPSVANTLINSAITTHISEADPHSQYQRESEKAAANGYASLDAGIKIPIAQIPTLPKANVGLGNVDNTSDASKPVSTDQQTAIDAKVSDIAYNATSWDGVTTIAASKNAVRDKFESLIIVTYSEITASQIAVVNAGYITNNTTLITVTLPDIAPLGSIVSVKGSGAGGWKVAQNAGEKIVWDAGGVAGTNETTTGIGGFLLSTDRYDKIELICITANTTWAIKSSHGLISLT